MLNYMKSECYRTIRNRNFQILVCVCAVLMIALVFVLLYFGKDPSFPYANTRFALGNIYMQMNFILLVAIVFSAFLHDNEEQNHTIKHSVAFGIKRSTIYLGRFLLQASVCIISYIVLVSIFTVLSFVLLPHQNVGELESLIRVSLGSSTSLLAALAITHYFLMVSENQSTAFVGALSILAIIPIICNMLGRKVAFIEKLATLFPFNVVSTNGLLVYVEGNLYVAILKSFIIGALWLAFFLILGILKFSKKEVK